MRGEAYLKGIIVLLNKRNVKLVLVSTPYYSKSIDIINQFQQAFISKYALSFTNENHVSYFDYQFNRNFSEEDFYDEAHLSEYGANKFTTLLKKQIESLP